MTSHSEYHSGSPTTGERTREKSDRFIIVLGAMCVFLLILVIILLGRVGLLSTRVDNLNDAIRQAGTDIHTSDLDAKQASADAAAARAQSADNRQVAIENREVVCAVWVAVHDRKVTTVPVACRAYVAGLSGNGG